MRSNKKGLSPVISSVLLILLVLVLAVLIFLWARGFITEQIEKFGKPIEQICESVDFEVYRIEGNKNQDTLENLNRGNVNINSLEIKMFKDGDSEIKKFDVIINSMSSIIKVFSLEMEGEISPDKIEIFPVLIGNVKGEKLTKPFVCMDNGKTITF